MSRLLLFLSLLGAAIYSLLIYTHDVLTDDRAEKTYAEQTQANHPGPHLSSWGTHLPDRKVSKDSKLATSQLTTSLPLLESDEPRQNSERAAEQPATSAVSSSGSDGAEPEPELVKVVLAAQTHSQASVSSPTVRFYRPGTKLQVVRREGIWFEVSDPVTQERGWVLAQYLSSIDGPTPTQVATESTTEPLTGQARSPKIKQADTDPPKLRFGGARRVIATADPWNDRSARRADRRRRVGLSMFAPRRMRPNGGHRRCAAWSEGFCVQNLLRQPTSLVCNRVRYESAVSGVLRTTTRQSVRRSAQLQSTPPSILMPPARSA